MSIKEVVMEAWINLVESIHDSLDELLSGTTRAAAKWNTSSKFLLFLSLRISVTVSWNNEANDEPR
jgi:hypothetical protein